MIFSTLDSIERQINQLPRGDQLRLIERVVHQLSESEERHSTSDSEFGSLESMAEDPDILRECAAVEREFGPVELDGLQSK